MQAGRAEDAVRLRLQRARVENETPRASRRDALLLAEILKSDIFGAILGDARAENYFGSAITALHYFCRALSATMPGRGAVEAQTRFLAVSSCLELTTQHSELLRCCLSEPELESLSQADPNTAKKDAMDTVIRVYRWGREHLITRLSAAQFLEWLDEGLVLDATSLRTSSRNPYSLESSAVDAFYLSQGGNQSKAQVVRVEDLKKRILNTVKTPSLVGADTAQQGIFTRALGVSSRREMWSEWAGQKKGLISRYRAAGETVFVPSILFICVGIAVVIVLSFYVQQIAMAISSRDVIVSLMEKLKDFNYIFQNMAVGSLNLATCVDPAQFKTMQRTQLKTFLPQLADWDPVSSEMERISQDPRLTSIVGSLASMIAGLAPPSIPTQDVILADPGQVVTMLQDFQSNVQNLEVSLITFKDRLIEILPDVLLTSVFSVVTNITRPEVLSTMPVYGSTAGCLYKQFTTPEVQGFINSSLTTVNDQTSKAQVQIPTTVRDTCRCTDYE